MIPTVRRNRRAKNDASSCYEHFERFHEVMAEDSGQSVLPVLQSHVVPLVPGLHERLMAGVRVLNLGCGRGRILKELATLYPRSRFVGMDLSADAVAHAARFAAGVPNIEFLVRDLSDFDRSAEPEAFDVVTTFDAVHDQARPLAVLQGIHRTLKADGVCLMQDISGTGHVHSDVAHPLGTLLYTVSCMHCMTVSLAQGGEGLGAGRAEDAPVSASRRLHIGREEKSRSRHSKQLVRRAQMKNRHRRFEPSARPLACAAARVELEAADAPKLCAERRSFCDDAPRAFSLALVFNTLPTRRARVTLQSFSQRPEAPALADAQPSSAVSSLPSPAARPLGDDAASTDTGRVLQTLLGNLDGMVYRCRNDADWTMVFVSEGCERVTGYRPSDLLLNDRVSYEEITHVEDRERVRSIINDALRERRRFDLEYRIKHADGGIRWVWERGVGLYGDSGHVIALEGIIQDVTRRMEADLALREAERRYHSLFENAIEGIFRTSPDGHYLDANPALARIYGFDTPQDLIHGLRDIRRQLYVDPTRREEFMRIIKARGSIGGFESQVFRKNGDVIWISENARAVFDGDGHVLYYEGTVEDVTERKLYQARIEQQANYDTLTGLANRSLLNDRLHQAILTAASYGTRLAVVFVDLDRFKFINDSLGHHVGDQLLQVMAERFKSCIREFDTVARLGGDEFVLLINGQGEPDSVGMTMERLLKIISRPWRSSQGEFEVTCSIGVALYPDDGADAVTLLKHADSAMYRAKEHGRNNFQFFTNELNQLMKERLELESNLRRALERGQFDLLYQPRVDLRTRKIVGCEALIRWQLPNRGCIQPSVFVPIAEEVGLIGPIGRWVLQTACAQNKAWQDAGFPPHVVSVNVSPRQFRRDDLAQTIAEVLEATGMEARWLEIELTENMVMHDGEQMIDMLHAIKRLGVHISVDDFGTGYSSLSYLKRFPVDRLKVDRSFVKDIATDGDSAAIVRTIIALGHNLGLKVVAEGVETEEQIGFLAENACDELQGYYFSKPVSGWRFRKLLTPPKAPGQ